ncbi:MAG: FtsX-like permease family protein [Richelia sp.]|nr:FtsX-like permease family protein [Richelia sp.]CDN15098.1 ABC-type antimicrobial peptide transport system, permease component [Richelia intracellularis]
MLLSRLISTQRDQIAVIKTFGYNNQAFAWHYLKFVLAIVFVPGSLGTAVEIWFGMAVTENYTQFFSFPILRFQAAMSLIVGAIAISPHSTGATAKCCIFEV